MKSSTLTAGLLSIFFILYGVSSNASIVLSKVGSDLLLQVENPVIFTVSTNVSTSRLGFLLPGAIDVAGTGGFQLTSDPLTEPTLSGTGFFSGDPDVALIRGGSTLEILYFLSSTTDFTAGDQVTLSPGELVLPNFFDSSIINGLNYTVATEAILSQTSGIAISDPTLTAIPVPGAFLLFSSAVVMLGFGSYRKT